MDTFDRASELESAEREECERRERAKVPVGDWREISAKWCMEPTCGIRIPDARRRAFPGVQWCMECAERAERQQKRRKRL